MKDSINSEEQIVGLINESREKYEGTFKASVDDVEFMFADTKLVFYRAGEEYFIIGADDKRNSVAFCVPRAIKEGPHEVKWYKGGLVWSVSKDGDFHEIQQGVATVTFLQSGEYKYGVKGKIDFSLPRVGKITGKFEIKLRE